MGQLRAFAQAPDRALHLVREGLEGRGDPASVWDGYLSNIAEQLKAGRSPGSIWEVAGELVGVVCWDRAGPLGIAVDLIHLARPGARPEAYAGLLDALEESVGPVAFLAGPLSPLSADEESTLLTPRGFARYSRSEMLWREAGRRALDAIRESASSRRIASGDEEALAQLHQSAYHGRFDLYLFLEDREEKADARRHVRDLLGGRWGEMLADGSRIAVEGGRAVGAVLSVRRPEGVLVADVMVAPDRQGRGIGRSLLASALRGLADGGERHIVLNVTEGNSRAVRLYEHLGFVRSLGPSKDWYRTRAIPVGPTGS